MKHKLTAAQAARLGRRDLAGETVDVVMMSTAEQAKHKLQPNTRMAKKVSYRGKYLGAYLNLSE